MKNRFAKNLLKKSTVSGTVSISASGERYTSYRGVRPLFESEFKDNALTTENYKSHFLGHAIDMNGYKSDLYLIEYVKGGFSIDRYNAIIKYAEDDPCYSSGLCFMINALVYKQSYNEALVTLYKRAIKAGILKEKSYIVGYSEKLNDLEDEKYYNSEYYLNRPENVNYLSKEIEAMSDDDVFQLEKETKQKQNDYDNAYRKEHGSVPIAPVLKNPKYHTFESEKEAQKYCGKYWRKVNAFSKSHLNEIVKEIDFNKMIMKDLFG
jgi:hypothetical protein